MPILIESLDQEGRGVAHVDGKAVFVEGALPGEEVTALVLRDRPTYAVARVVSILRASASRVTPALPPLRHVRRLHAAARASVAADRRQAAGPRGCLRPHRPRAAGPHAAADRGAGVAVPLSRPSLRAPRAEEGRRAGGLPRAEVELRRRHDRVSRRAAQALGPAACAARPDRRTDLARPATADRSGDRRDGGRAELRDGAAHPRAADGGRRGAARGVCARIRGRILAADRRSRHRRAVLPARFSARLSAAGVRGDDALRVRPTSRR